MSYPRPKSKASLREMLRDVNQTNIDPETSHIQMDDLLLAYINDPEVTAEFKAQTKWYA